MPTKSPSPTDFPSHLTLTITPPPGSRASSSSPSPNILLLLHGLGDSAAGFTAFARALQLPETTIVTLQAPTPLPFDLGGFHWGDDVAFDSGTGGLDMDAGFAGAARTTIVEEVVRGVLVRKCGYGLSEIMMLGFGQGGMAGLMAARELGKESKTTTTTSSSSSSSVENNPHEESDRCGSLAGVISIGAPYPLSGGSRIGAKRNRTPVLLVAGRDSAVVSDAAVQRTKEVFEFVEVHRYARRGDGMPKNRDEMLPVMQFFARRLRSRQGVPEGSIEIT